MRYQQQTSDSPNLSRKAKRLATIIAVAACALALRAPAKAQQPAGDGAAAGFGLNAKAFGAVGDCRHDDTAALQSAVNQVSGRTLFIPAGCYLISQPIKVPYAVGFRIIGEGRLGTKIQQQTDNTPILVFTQDLTFDWEVSYLEFAWSKNQPSQNTNAVAIEFASPGGKGGIFDFIISHVTFDNGFRGIYLAPGVQGALPVWGFSLENIVAAKLMSGATINLSPQPVVGMPRCMLRDIYSTQPSSEPQIALHHCTSGTLDNIEDNNGVDTALDLTSSEGISVRSVHIEYHHMAHPNRPVIAVENAWVDFDGITADIWSEVAGRYWLFSNVAGGGVLGIRNVLFRGIAPETSRPGATNSSSASTYLLRLNGTVKLTEIQGVDLIHAQMSASDDGATAAKVSALGKPVQ